MTRTTDPIQVVRVYRGEVYIAQCWPEDAGTAMAHVFLWSCHPSIALTQKEAAEMMLAIHVQEAKAMGAKV